MSRVCINALLDKTIYPVRLQPSLARTGRATGKYRQYLQRLHFGERQGEDREPGRGSSWWGTKDEQHTAIEQQHTMTPLG